MAFERVEQALVGRSDVVKCQRILQYVLHNYHQELKKVIDAAQGNWERFKEGMQRKYRLGDGLLTTADLEAMNKEDFTTIGAFVQEFKKRAWKVHEISAEAQCAIFLGLLTASEAVELTRHGGGSTKLTWATIDRGVEVGCLDQVEQRQYRLQRQKRKERDATASGTPGVKRIVTDVLAQLGYATEPVVKRRVVTVVQVKGKEPVVEEAVEEELWEEEEPVSLHLTKAQRKLRNLVQGGQGSGKGQAPQAQAVAPPNVAAPSGRLKQGSQRRYKTVDKKCHPVPVLITEDEDAYYERERGLIQRMSESPLAGPCRVNEGNEGKLIIGEPNFLLPQERMLMVELMKRRHHAYVFSDEERGRLDVDKIPMIRIHTVPHEPWNMRGARYPNPDEEKKVVDYLDGTIRTHVADYSSGPYASPWFCFIKPNGTLRWVQDLQRPNAVTVQDAGGLPNADALSESCAGRPIISLIDLYSGYDQFPVYPPDRLVTTMHTPRGLIHMNVAPQGWTNAVAMVQRAMIRAMQSISPHITQPHIDDLAVKGPAIKESDEVLPGVRRFVWKHIQDLDKVTSLLEEHNLTTSGTISRYCMGEATILGFICSEKGRRPDVKKTDKIIEWLVPFHSITDVRSFLGSKNRADGLSRINWDKREGEAVENTPPVDGFLDQEEDVRLHINKWSPRVPSSVGYPIWQTPSGYERRAELVLKPFEEEDHWGGKDIQWMMELALASSHSLVEDMKTIEEGSGQVERHEDLMGGMYLLVNTLLQEGLDQSDFTKTAMPKGGKGTRPPRRPLGASGGYEWHGSRYRESTPVYDDGDIKLFLDSLWEHARRMGWTVAQAIERLRGAGRFEEPITRIHREATTSYHREPEAAISGRSGQAREQPTGRAEAAKAWFARTTTYNRDLSGATYEESYPGAGGGESPEGGGERETFEFRAPTELATLPIATTGPVMPLADEEGLPPSRSESAQGSAEGSMNVLIEAVHSMQEEASLFSPERRIEEPLEREMRIEAEGVIEGGLQRLGTPEYGPEGIEDRPGPSTQEVETREEPLDMPQSHELSREASEAPSSPGAQRGKKRSRKWFDTSCFFCTKEGHRALQCPKFLKDKAEGKVTEEGGRMYDRQGRRVKRSADGGRAQLYRQNQEEMSDQD
ncbi:hypothetical protein CBR_g38160 [Chara braunii]|uniref:CCHC-type domain-containing protein n=1 Tax=Chara braunii TaxID=69332 RepID=A0A388LPK2_CHABU|nr:hypothetical protein CBR_g38160 [Chara braunii]|eukprot:GBG84189.1 hypothetical protein CBR_g38160 [Chara braunii]